ncbi:MAG: DNA-3-methyladenine glycosylase [Bacteroidales bacterium]|jgi:DNA-3-methyladenine glycosylase|nr:DNA-3-methyladenine glycosylase [Bacteroidales bacterium]MDD3756393.1 DNA-3-methyladenine glycosylase [Bacteroidales bacterium]HOB78343.1 DNA-3-methyladenine glycosylase [Bacteroidales bacterium]HPZ61735.1 DNA-3-methyladenine glycosylase [Bacteroidales bacterium]HQD59453.1 DNA-3-methyladenine glycosylase [Bacteroidales bacterium]
MPLSTDFYLRNNVIEIAKSLIGKVIITQKDGYLTSGIITETEAYNGIKDKASHAYGGKKTKRNQAMYMKGGHAYVYLCYGIHHLFNIVTNIEGIPDAILVRAIYPLEGLEIMQHRAKMKKINANGVGPGKLTAMLSITTNDNTKSLINSDVIIEDYGFKVPDNQIIATTRVGIDYAGEDARLPYRFLFPHDKINQLFKI